MTTNCLINQAACGREAGNPLCPKCGMDERVVYPGQADLDASLEAARARYVAVQEALEFPQSFEPQNSPPESPPQPPKQPDPEPLTPKSGEKTGIKRLGLGVLVVALMGGGWWWKTEQDERVRLAQERAAQEAQAAEQARIDREAALQRADEAEAKRVAAEKDQVQIAVKAAEAARLAEAERSAQLQRDKQAQAAARQAEADSAAKLSRDKVANEDKAKQSANVVASPQRLPFEAEMVRIPAGSFTMGSPASEPGRDSEEGPQHTVRVAAFELGKYEVTFDEWDACVNDGGCSYQPRDRGNGRGRLPVLLVSWEDINIQFIPWLNRKTGKRYRLPSEAEWEYAARAGCRTAFNVGGSCLTKIESSDANFNSNYAYNGSTVGGFIGKTTIVGSYKANTFGLYDMLGNVLEWVQDCWNDSYAASPSRGEPWLEGDCESRVIRGGSLMDEPKSLRASTRGGAELSARIPLIGFRLARTIQ